jgi:hypothetical protein
MEEQVQTQLIKSKNTYKIVIPVDVEKKIRYICSKVWDTEWSGTLFYTYNGSFENKDLTITCKDIFVMDIGNATYTEFDMSPDVISYMTENPDLLDTQMGLIHSHNNMATFFSGTDTETLRKEGIDRNIFVSLIVNNAGTYTAAVTRHIKSVSLIKESNSYEFFGEGPKESNEEYYEKSEYIEYSMLNVIKENERTDFDDVASRLDAIKKAKEEKKKEAELKKAQAPGTYVPPFLYSKNNGNKDIYFNKTIFSDNIDTIKAEDVEYHFSKETVRNVAVQLLTCSVLVTPSKIDLKAWIRNIDSTYSKRFGSNTSTFGFFRPFAESLCEYLLSYIDDDSFEKVLDESEQMSLMASDLTDFLKKLPKSRYIDVYIEILENYIL